MTVTDVYDRVDAISATVALWPSEPLSGSSFAADNAVCSVAATYDVARHQLLSAIRRLRDAATLAVQDDGWGSQILMLRPALVLVAKAAWVLRPEQCETRVGRALGTLVSDQRRGAIAMRDAVSQGAIAEFGHLAEKYEGNAGALESSVSVPSIKPPADQAMIRELGRDVDLYDGSDDTQADMQLLWNASSSLAHGETWFNQLTGGMGGQRLGDVLTSRSFDCVCSGINVTSLRIHQLSTGMSGLET